MVAAYNGRAAEAGIPETEMRAVQGDILSGNEGEKENASEEAQNFTGEEYFNFDMAVMSMALHHVASPPAAVKALVSRLRKGGSVVIIDWFLDSVVYHGGDERQHGGAAHQHHHHHHQGHAASHGDAGRGHAHNVVPGSEHTITRDGFGKEEMETMFTDAGCAEVEFRLFSEDTRMGDGEQAVMQRMFIVKGTKA